MFQSKFIDVYVKAKEEELGVGGMLGVLVNSSLMKGKHC